MRLFWLFVVFVVAVLLMVLIIWIARMPEQIGAAATVKRVPVRYTGDRVVFPKSGGTVWFPYVEAGRARPRQAFTI